MISWSTRLHPLEARLVTSGPRVACALAVAAALSLTACSSASTPAPAFTAKGGAGPTAATSAPASSVGKVVMPPFGPKAHVEMTSWLPANPDEAAAVVATKNLELAFLYADYTSGKDKSWRNYVSSTWAVQVGAQLSQPNVTTQSFIGTVRYFDMRAFQDPRVPGEIDVSACFDNAQASNTSARTGKVLPDTTPADQHYWRFTDQVAKNSAGTWQVVGAFPVSYYPREKECKP